MTADGLAGGCSCGTIRYVAAGVPRNPTLCHCADCRRAAGAPAIAWFSIDAADLHVTRGAPKRFRSSERATRGFCPECGTQLLFEADGSGEIDIATATLDDPERVPPLDHTWAKSRLTWDHLSPTLPLRYV